MEFMMNALRNRHLGLYLLLLVMMCYLGCSSFYLDDCPEDGVLGVDKPRIRSWRIRTIIHDKAAAADRFADYAAMSAYAYAVQENQACSKERKIMPDDEEKLLNRLNNSGWKRYTDVEYAPLCEDDVGLFYHAWKRESDEKIEVVIAFRGTWGFSDWWYGNSYWFRRFCSDKHQYSAARKYADNIIQYTENNNVAAKVLEFSSTGHSLGGGLAQAVFYDHANSPTFKQAYAFDPSPATAYTSRRDKKAFEACDYSREFPEPRIYRIYESYEVLSGLRIFHKFFFPPEPWINEVRFSYSEDNPVAQHAMLRFALELMNETSASGSKKDHNPWYASDDDKCTSEFQESQRSACNEN